MIEEEDTLAIRVQVMQQVFCGVFTPLVLLFQAALGGPVCHYLRRV